MHAAAKEINQAIKCLLKINGMKKISQLRLRPYRGYKEAGDTISAL